jgi:protein disulfide-isomerase
VNEMKRLLIVGVAAWMALGSGLVAADDEAVWMDDFEAAKARAKETGRAILVNFSGSDWCGWCKKLDREVWSKEIFQGYADENLVLLLADFPSKKKLAQKVAEQNAKLAAEFGVKGFPTVLLLDQAGGLIAVTGYRPGGAEEYVDHIKRLLKSDG